MEMISENIRIQQQYKQGFAIKQEINKEVTWVDITNEQWFWDIAVIS